MTPDSLVFFLSLRSTSISDGQEEQQKHLKFTFLERKATPTCHEDPTIYIFF